MRTTPTINYENIVVYKDGNSGSPINIDNIKSFRKSSGNKSVLVDISGSSTSLTRGCAVALAPSQNGGYIEFSADL